jgi:hypothetical protein
MPVFTSAVNVTLEPTVSPVGGVAKTDSTVGALLTTCAIDALEADKKFVSPLYTAVMEWLLATRVEMENVAALPLIDTVPSAVTSSMKAIEPVAPDGTVAVKATEFW